jgi:hypothetical protein
MSRVVRDPVYSNTAVSVTVDFASKLALGETINDVPETVVTSSVYSGDSDELPNSIVFSTHLIAGSQITQKIANASEGTIYDLCFTAATSLGQLIPISCYIACVPKLP